MEPLRRAGEGAGAPGKLLHCSSNEIAPDVPLGVVLALKSNKAGNEFPLSKQSLPRIRA